MGISYEKFDALETRKQRYDRLAKEMLVNALKNGALEINEIYNLEPPIGSRPLVDEVIKKLLQERPVVLIEKVDGEKRYYGVTVILRG